MTSRSSRPLSLAIAAVLGVSGLGLLASPAGAAPLSAGLDVTQVELLTQFTGVASYQADGTDSTVRLEAVAGQSVSQVRFSVRPSSPLPEALLPYTVISTVNRNDDGGFAAEWDPSDYDGLDVDLRVTALGSGGAVIGTDNVTGVAVTTDWTANIANGPTLRYFAQPYTERTRDLAILTGTVGRIGTNASRQMDVGYFTGTTAPTTKAALYDPVANSTGGKATQGIGSFAHILDITEYDVQAAPATNQILTYAAMYNTAGTTALSDDAEAYELKKQVIGSITATPDRPNVAPGESATVTVTVLDKDGLPVAGAEVRSGTGTGAPQWTDARGTASFLQLPGSTTYYVNATDSNPYAAGEGDFQTPPVVISAYQPVTTSISGASADGSAFDLDEVDNLPSTGTGTDGDATDVTVQVKDQQGNAVTPASGQSLTYTWKVTPFAGGASTTYPATGSSTAVSEGGGKYSVVVPAGGDGTYELFAALSGDPISSSGTIVSSKVLSVKAGQAAIVYDKNSPEEATAGGTTPISGRLALSDGTVLPGRALAFTFQRDATTTGEDATPDAGFGNGQGAPTTSLEQTTSSTGLFSFSVNDPAETPQQSEIGDNIDAASAANALGNAGAVQDNHVVNFIQDTTPANLTLTDGRGSTTLRPGEFTLYTVRVTNRLGSGVANQEVKLTTDKGYFSLDDGSAATTSPTPAPSPTAGADAGTYRNDGTAVTVKTGSDGTATVFLAMGRETGFDDDGLVTTTVGATAGTLTGSDDHPWTSANPLNGGAVAVVASDRPQDSAILPKAQTSDKVYVDVLVTDQFGNAVGGESVALTDDSAGTIAETDGTANDGTIVSDFARDGDATLSSAVGAPQKVTATWTTERTTYTGVSSATTTGNETLTGAYTAEWYAVDYAASNITFTPDGSGTRDVGSSVTLTYKALDQLGQPISDLYIAFARSGPGTVSDTSGAANTLTGADGVATYTFTGNAGGRADVSATARQGSATGEVVSAASRSASVSFAADKVRPDITVTKRIVGNRVVLRVSVTATSQDPVVGDVEITDDDGFVVTKSLNDNGRRKFVFRGVPRGFHSYDVTFVGNDQVKSRTRTITFNVR